MYPGVIGGMIGLVIGLVLNYLLCKYVYPRIFKVK